MGSTQAKGACRAVGVVAQLTSGMQDGLLSLLPHAPGRLPSENKGNRRLRNASAPCHIDARRQSACPIVFHLVSPVTPPRVCGRPAPVKWLSHTYDFWIIA